MVLLYIRLKPRIICGDFGLEAVCVKTKLLDFALQLFGESRLLSTSIESNYRRVMAAFDGCTLTRVHFFMRRRCRRCRFRRRSHRPQVYDDERLDGASDRAF